MSRFAFLFNQSRDSTKVLTQSFRSIFATLAPWLRYTCFTADSFCLVSAHSDYDPPCFIEGERYFIFVEGSISDSNLLSLREKKPITKREIDYIETLLESGRRDQLCGLNGNYALIAISRRRSEIILTNDSLGSIHVYFGSIGKSFFIGNCTRPVLSLANHQPAPDKTGLFETLLLGGPLYTRTLFQNVQCMPPGSSVIFKEAYNKTVFSKPFPLRGNLYETDLPSLTNVIYERLNDAFTKRVVSSEPILLPLSGGLDSRVLAGLAVRNRDKHVRAVTVGRKNDWDLWAARKLAKRLGIRHEFHPLDDKYLWNMLETHSAIAEGNSDVCYSIGYLLASLAVGKGGSILTGYLGDTTQGTALDDVPVNPRMTPEEMAQSRFHYANRRYFAPDDLSTIIRPNLWKEYGNQPLNDLTELYAKLPGSTFQKNILVDLLTEQRRQTGTHYAHLRLAGRVHAPYSDLHYLQTMLSMPPVALNKRYAFRMMIARHFPELAEVPVANDKKAIQASERQHLFNNLRIIVSRRKQRIFNSLGLSKLNPSFWSLLHGTWSNGFQMLEQYVDQHCAILDFMLDPKQLKVFLDTHRRLRDFRYPGQIRVLATLINTFSLSD